MAQGYRRRVPGIVCVGGHELFRQRQGTEPLQVHGQERGVVKPVQPAEPVIEVQAVQDPRPVIKAEDVVGEQVTVPVDDAAIPDPRIEQRRPPGQEPQGQPLRLLDDRGVERLARRQPRLDRPGLLDVVRPAAVQRVPAALLGDLRAAGRLGVPGGEDPRHLAQRPGHWRARADQRGQPPRRGHAAHHHQVIADLAIRVAELGHTQVHIRRKLAVELDLAGTRRRAGLRRAEVEETELDGFLQLASAVPGEEHRGSVGLGHLSPWLVSRPVCHRPFLLGHPASPLGTSLRAAAGSGAGSVGRTGQDLWPNARTTIAAGSPGPGWRSGQRRVRHHRGLRTQFRRARRRVPAGFPLPGGISLSVRRRVSVTVDVGLAQMFRAGILMGLVVVVHVGMVVLMVTGAHHVLPIRPVTLVMDDVSMLMTMD